MDATNTRALFQIKAVKKDDDKVVFSDEVVAEGEKEALYESGMKEELKKQGLTRDDVNILVKSFGSLPPKEVVKNVKIVAAAGGMTLVQEKKS